MRRSTRRPVVDLPQPDSPTSASVSPAASAKLTSSTACTTAPSRAEPAAAHGKVLDQASTAKQLAHAARTRLHLERRVPAARDSGPRPLRPAAAACGAALVGRRTGSAARSGSPGARRADRAPAPRSRAAVPARDAAWESSPAARWCTDAADARTDPPRRPSPRCARNTSPPRRAASSATTPRSCVMRMIAVPVSSRSCRMSSRICAWIVTSSAVVGSSAMSSRGRHASAIAIIARWRMPPESLCG